MGKFTIKSIEEQAAEAKRKIEDAKTPEEKRKAIDFYKGFQLFVNCMLFNKEEMEYLS